MLRPRDLSRSVALFAARTPTLAPATHTNSYAIGARDVVLVEPATPYEDEQRAWIEWARALELPVWAHDETAKRVPEVPVARRLEEGEEIVLEGPADERWRVLHTPGHAPGHLCLFEERTRTVIVGDMVASVGTILIAPG